MADILDSHRMKLNMHASMSNLAQIGPIINPRNRHIFVLDVLALTVIPIIALVLHRDGIDWLSGNGSAVIFFIVVALSIKLPLFHSCGLYQRYWRYASLNDLFRIAAAVLVTTVVLTAFFFLLQPLLISRGLPIDRTLSITDGILTLLFVGGVRFGVRAHYQWRRESRQRVSGERVLIVGAGQSGTAIAREIRSNPQLNMSMVGFVDDNIDKLNTYIESLPVVGTVAELPALLDRRLIERVILAMPSAPLGRQQEIAEVCEAHGVAATSMPGAYQLLAGHKTIQRVPKVDVALLLGREPANVNSSETIAGLCGKTVLVTGAGGSIGSELCRQIAQSNPARIILLGHGENSIFEIGLELRLTFPDVEARSAIVDVRNRQLVDKVIKQHSPDIVFHAAAHKHVPFMEANAAEAILNNVLGTRNVLDAAEKHAVERFVMVSTDKAVNPSSMMGVTKRLAELLVQAAAQRTGRPYMIVRFGNVLGSRGSVVPIFQRQIAMGGPLTITHPEMRRYFMTIPEAALLVLKAAELGKGGEIFLLDMGEPVYIIDMAQRYLALCGLQLGRDIEIIHTGIRPGEKLSEELFTSSEACRQTSHEKILVTTQNRPIDSEKLEAAVSTLMEIVHAGRTERITSVLQAIVPEYRPNGMAAAVAPDSPPTDTNRVMQS